MFLHFCEMLFLELVYGGVFLGIPYLHVLSFFTCNLFLGGKRDHLMFCYVEIVHRES